MVNQSSLYKPQNSYMGLVKDIKLLPKETLTEFRRAGVFLSIKNDKEKFYLFSIQQGSIANHIFIRDLGGRIEPGEHPIDGAYREFYEESLGVFTPYLTEDSKDNAKVYKYKDNLYVFLELEDVNIPQIIAEFDELKNLPEDSPDCMKETMRIISIDRYQIFKKLKKKHHVKQDRIYYGPSLWKTIRAFALAI